MKTINVLQNQKWMLQCYARNTVEKCTFDSLPLKDFKMDAQHPLFQFSAGICAIRKDPKYSDRPSTDRRSVQD